MSRVTPRVPRVQSRRELYSESTRSALLETATAMFAEHGFTATSLDDIAAATQVTRGAVYHHFDSKQALFEAVLEIMGIRTCERVAAAAAKHTDVWDAALAGVDQFLDECCDPVYGRLCWQEGPVALGWVGWMELEQRFSYGLTEKFMRAAMDAGYLAPAPLEPLTRLMFNLIGGAGHAIAEAAEDDKHRVRDECAMLMRRMLAGLRTQ